MNSFSGIQFEPEVSKVFFLRSAHTRTLLNPAIRFTGDAGGAAGRVEGGAARVGQADALVRVVGVGFAGGRVGARSLCMCNSYFKDRDVVNDFINGYLPGTPPESRPAAG